MKFNVSQKELKTRLDKFLTQYLPDYSRSWIQKLIKEGLILVNQKKVSSHYILKQGDKIKVELKKPETIDLSPKKGKLDIVFEDKNFLVVNKPAGLVVHPSLAHRKGDTLVNLLLACCPEIKNVGEKLRLEVGAPDPAGSRVAPKPLLGGRPGIVHRLDKDVSGLMVIAKTQRAFEHLKDQFKNRKVKKEYLVLVHGKVKELKGRISFSIGRSKKKGFKMIIRPSKSKNSWASLGGWNNQEGRPSDSSRADSSRTPARRLKTAETFYQVIKHFPNYTLLKIQIKTGRTHQIRVHLNAIGHPIVGEKIYKPRKFKTEDIGRLFLHACTLGFWDLDGKWKEFKISLPMELKQFFKINLLNY